jgi:hypothetical protein
MIRPHAQHESIHALHAKSRADARSRLRIVAGGVSVTLVLGVRREHPLVCASLPHSPSLPPFLRVRGCDSVVTFVLGGQRESEAFQVYQFITHFFSNPLLIPSL